MTTPCKPHGVIECLGCEITCAQCHKRYRDYSRNGETAKVCTDCYYQIREWEIAAAEKRAEELASYNKDLLFEINRMRLRDDAKRKLAEERYPLAELPPAKTLAEHLEEGVTPTEYRIQDWLPVDSRTILTAQYKAGKTTAVGNLVRSLVDGDAWLGAYDAESVSGNVAIMDFEMGENQLKGWLGDQGIHNTDQVILFPLRGKAGLFDLRDPDRMTWWADTLMDHDVEYVIWDCFRPVMDALGLNENSEAGIMLTAFDALLDKAEITEALVVQHMGHTGERSRGDSRLQDWPEVTWKLVRADSENPASTRFISAFGRDVDIPESAIAFDASTRHLAMVGGSRLQAKARAAVPDIVALIRKTGEPMSGRKIEEHLLEESNHSQKAIREGLKVGLKSGDLIRRDGPKRAYLYETGFYGSQHTAL